MSTISIQKHLACHDYHMGFCALPKDKCPYSHVGKSWGICPNKNYCPTPHKFVDCPLFEDNSCPKGDSCSYRHTKKVSNQEQMRINQKCENPEEEQKSSDIKNNKQNQKKQDLNISTILNEQQNNKALTIEDFKSNLLELSQDLKITKPFLENEKRKNEQIQQREQDKKIDQIINITLDLCFIVDITGSMGPYLTQVVNYMRNTVNELYNEFPGILLNVGFSGYRDIKDAERFVIVNFSQNIDFFNSQISKIAVSGGGDEAEDVCGGLTNALNFNWYSDAKQAIFITDAPAHGIRYHDGAGDDYPMGDPCGFTIEDLMKDFSKKEISFTAISINSKTQKMFSIMKTVYGPSMQIKGFTANPGIISAPKTKSDNTNVPGTLTQVIHEEIKSTVAASISKSGLKDTNGGSGSNNLQVKKVAGPRNQFQKAFEIVMENKRFKQSFSKTRSKERLGHLTENVLIQMIEENKVLDEEEEYDSDDSDYDQKLEETCKKQYTIAVKEKEVRQNRLQAERLEKLKKQFPAEYFQTVSEYEESNKKKKYKKSEKKVIYTIGKLKWDSFETYCEYQAVCYSFELVKNQKQEINWKNIETNTFYLGTKVKINESVFSEGAMRYAYQAKELYLKQNMVAKQYKRAEKQKQQTIQEMKRDILSQIVCKHIVKEFNSKMLEVLGNDAILFSFIDCYIYEMTFPYTSNNLFYFEKYIEGKYEKFNNNAGYVQDSENIYSILAQTLSHYSWQLTKGYLAIVDLQGNSYGILTDPQIHCLDEKQFGDGNLGYEGILRFFTTHECNDYCRMLNLINPFEQSSIPLTHSLLFDNNLISGQNVKDSTSLVSQLCDICSNLQPFIIQEYYDSKLNNTKLICKECKEKSSKSTYEKKCISCTHNFNFSTYECIQLRRDAPPLCNSCTVSA